MGLSFCAGAKADDGDAVAAHDGNAVSREGPFIRQGAGFTHGFRFGSADAAVAEEGGIGFFQGFGDFVVFRDDPCREVTFDGIGQAGVARAGVFIHADFDIVAVLLDARQSPDFIEAALPRFAGRHAAVQGDGTGIGDGAAARRGVENLGARDCTAAEEVGFFPFGIVFLVEHLDQAFDFRRVGCVIFVEGPHVLEDIGHLVNGVITAFGRAAVAGYTLDVDADFHAAALAAVDAVVCRFRGDDEFRTDLVFVDNVLPAEAVAVFFLDRTGDQDGVLVGQEAKVLHDAGAVDGRNDAAELIRRAAAADFRFRFKAFVGIEIPVGLVADADGVDVGVEADEGLAGAHVAQDVAHGVDFHFIEIEFAHFFGNAVDMFLFAAAFTGEFNDVPQETGHIRIADDEEELREICSNGLRLSRVNEVLIEKCIAGWKEIEYEVMRDGKGNCITVCNMENLDPVGVHTGDSIVVAPSQTLMDKEYQMLRSAALNIITELGIEGGCNVQFALHPDSFRYAVIEVNPRVSRSSALASKATGYPIARIAAKIALGLGLDEIPNAITKKTYASFEPALDYCVVKIPKWPFDKFVNAKRTLGTQMKATGEVMAISRSFECALQKALHSLEENKTSLLMSEYTGKSCDELLELLKNIDNTRLYVVAASIYNGISLGKIHDITKIDMWFLTRIENIVNMEKTLMTGACDRDTLLEAKRLGFTDDVIANDVGVSEASIKNLRRMWHITPSFSIVDTCAAEFKAETPYYYSDYCVENEVDTTPKKKKIIVLGSGPIRIGQGVEFDYCSVHSIWALKKAGCEAIIVNNNPETVSTDFDVSDKLYFEPLTPEYVTNIVEAEKPDGAIVQFGGQTAIKLTKTLNDLGVTILGTDADHVDAAEDRERFDEILEYCDIQRPKGHTVFTVNEALSAAHSLGYPVLVRPSYVLGGQGMQIAASDDDIREFMGIITRTIPDLSEHPVLVDKYLMGQEVEVDAICDGKNILIPGIMEHIDRAGIHSGDSISVYPAVTLSEKVQKTIVDYTKRLASALHVIGMMNIQFIVLKEEVYIIEVNPRSSRTVPYISKVTGIPAIALATRAMLGEKLSDMGYGTGLFRNSGYYAIKLPVFSFEKIIGADTSLGPEMKSTGEVLGISQDYNEALLKAFDGGGVSLPKDR